MSTPQNYIKQIINIVDNLFNHVQHRQQDQIKQKHADYIAEADAYDACCSAIETKCQTSLHIHINKLPRANRKRISVADYEIPKLNPTQNSRIKRFLSHMEARFNTASYEKVIRQYDSRIQDLQQIQHDEAAIDVVSKDFTFIQSLHHIFSPDTEQHDEFSVFHMLHDIYNGRVAHSLSISDDPSVQVQLPHPAVATWFIKNYASKSAYISILAWGSENHTDNPHDPYHRVLDFFRRLDSQPKVIRQLDTKPEVYTLKGFHDISKDIIRPSSLLKTERQRKQYFGQLNKDPYTFAYVFAPNEYSQKNSYNNEDALLFDIVQNDFFVAVCDGVSQSCLGDIAARNVADALYRAWLLLIHGNRSLDELETVFRISLKAAKIRSEYDIAQFLKAPPQDFSSTTIDILRNLNNTGGSQTIFACTFSLRESMYALWMGNSAITIKGDKQNTVLSYDDPRFQSDSHRFSSQAENGLRGDLNIVPFPKFLKHNTTWRVVIHSDALEEYPNREELFRQPLHRVDGKPNFPDGRPLNADDNHLMHCIQVDDTTLIELFHSPPMGNS